MTLPLYDLNTPAGLASFTDRLAKLKATACLTGQQASLVGNIINDVRQRGDDALVQYMQKWTCPDFQISDILVPEDQLAQAIKQIDPPLLGAIKKSIEHVLAYQKHVCPADVKPLLLEGAELGMRFLPMDSAGLAVPGGSAVLFSTLIMLACPALAAGVDANNLAVIHPPATRMQTDLVSRSQSQADAKNGANKLGISPIVLGTCHLLGIKKVYAIGGAQAVAALAFGTQTVEPVDMIAGPGNAYVQLAKAMVAGQCGTDGGFYGPSEIVTIADTSANPAYVASDLLAQAEHNPGKCFLISWSQQAIDAILQQVAQQKIALPRLAAIDAALANESCALLVKDQSHAKAVANQIAAEHVNLAVADPASWASDIRHAGELFLGDQTPVAAGDYYAGPSHTLPTGTTARFASGISPYTFLKRTGTIHYKQGMSKQTIDHIANLAQAEGLGAHAASAKARTT